MPRRTPAPDLLGPRPVPDRTIAQQVDLVFDYWNTRPRLPLARRAPYRVKALTRLLRQYTVDEVLNAIDAISASDWLIATHVTLDFLFEKAPHMANLLEGRYRNRTAT